LTRRSVSDAFFMLVGVPLLLLATMLVFVIFVPYVVWNKLTYRPARKSMGTAT
jgi:hypothetical protein